MPAVLQRDVAICPSALCQDALQRKPQPAAAYEDPPRGSCIAAGLCWGLEALQGMSYVAAPCRSCCRRLDKGTELVLPHMLERWQHEALRSVLSKAAHQASGALCSLHTDRSCTLLGGGPGGQSVSLVGGLSLQCALTA